MATISQPEQSTVLVTATGLKNTPNTIILDLGGTPLLGSMDPKRSQLKKVRQSSKSERVSTYPWP